MAIRSYLPEAGNLVVTNTATVHGQDEPDDAVSIVVQPEKDLGPHANTINTFLEQIGIRPGDRIYSLNEKRLLNFDMLFQTGLELLKEIREGTIDNVTVGLQRGNFVQVEIIVNLTN